MSSWAIADASCWQWFFLLRCEKSKAVLGEHECRREDERLVQGCGKCSNVSTLVCACNSIDENRNKHRKRIFKDSTQLLIRTQVCNETQGHQLVCCVGNGQETENLVKY